MITNHWKLMLQKGERQIVLYATTTDRMVERDLQAEPARSLIQQTRQYHRRGQTSGQDHQDLAVAAFMSYAQGPEYDLAFEHMEPCAHVPEGVPNRYVEGADHYPLVPIWERDALGLQWGGEQG